MKQLTALAILAASIQTNSYAQKLIVRMDDIAGAHSMNEAIIKCYDEGIGTDTEVLAIGPWLREAAELCNARPGLDVGVHLSITSEWMGYKWRPLTQCPSLCDGDGYLRPNLSEASSINIEEAERELRAQIELVKKNFKNVSHLTDHMMFTFIPSLRALVDKLAAEYGLPYQGGDRDRNLNIGFISLYGRDGRSQSEMLLDGLKSMEPGRTYWTIEHPALDDAEMKGMFTHPGENVGADRQNVTDTFTNPEIIAYIKERGIELTTFAKFYSPHL